MVTEGTAPGEASKQAGYYRNERADVLAALPRPIGRALDVGCGAGRVAAGLREAGATEIVGIEVEPAAATAARGVVDVLLEMPVEQAIDRLEGEFDTVLCLDVLEHLVDPGAVLAGLRGAAALGARLQVSVPNARHYSLIRDLLLRGTFGYSDWGHRDSTHLRWFTRRDAVKLIGDAGWEVTGTSWPPLGRSAALHRVSGGRTSELLVAQLYVSARNPG